MAETSNFVLSQEDIEYIIKSHRKDEDNYSVKHIHISNLNDGKILGFIADYWKLQVELQYNNKSETNVFNFFIKAVSSLNAGKAAMMKEWNLLKKECDLYAIVRNAISYPGIKPWCASYVTHFDESLVFLDMNASNYRVRNKMLKFDEAHTKQALCTLARFHAASLLFEEKMRKQHKSSQFSVKDAFPSIFSEVGYSDSSQWFVQCVKSSLESIKTHSKYANDAERIAKIEKSWSKVCCSALNIESEKYRKVISHNDLWNNNIMFHYVSDKATDPDDCILVDFQVVGYNPPSADVLQLLYCNLPLEYRRDNMNMYLNYYYTQLGNNLKLANVAIGEILSIDDFFESADKYKKWAMISWACLVQTSAFDHDDEEISQLFRDENQFSKILNEDKTTFIINLSNKSTRYRDELLEIFEEIVETYCL